MEMEMYRLFYVATARSKPGKSTEAAKWWAEKGQTFYESLPGVKSLRTYAGQFGLSGDYGLEFWYEVEDYGVMDRWDADILERPDEYGPIFKEYNDLFESGPSRLMGEWPESSLLD
jgi:hypothetical protein